MLLALSYVAVPLKLKPEVGAPMKAVTLLPHSPEEHAVPVQTALWQLSPVVHALPSLQLVPSEAAGLEQAPVAASQVPAT